MWRHGGGPLMPPNGASSASPYALLCSKSSGADMTFSLNERLEPHEDGGHASVRYALPVTKGSHGDWQNRNCSGRLPQRLAYS